MSTPNPQETVANSGYNSGDETSSLLVRGPTPTPTVKPVLIRQDCTTLMTPNPTPPNLSHSANLMGNSDESGNTVVVLEESTARSVPDIELHCRGTVEMSTCRITGYQLVPRCSCERRKSHSLARSISRESVRSTQQAPPPVLLTTSPSSRIIRQSSQPETTTHITCHHCCPHLHHHGSASPVPSSSLRQLREPGDGIAMIAADSLRINGAIRQFKQVLNYSWRYYTLVNKMFIYLYTIRTYTH